MSSRSVPAVLLAVTVLLGGCGARSAQPPAPAAGTAPAGTAAAQPGSPPPVGPGMPAARPSPSATAAPSASSRPRSAATTAGDRSRAVRPAAGCPSGSVLHPRWASWPMPNPPGSGLPHPAAYRNLGDGTVLDRVTCLRWQRAAAPGTRTWSAAREYCRSLRLAGTGWRLPTRVELSSLTDFTRANPAIDTTAFPGTPPRFFWTGTPWTVEHDPPYAWMINFYEGLATNAGNTRSAFHVRCVRAPAGSGDPVYDRSAPGEVGDRRTGLVWQRASAAPMTATQAVRHCTGLTLGGHRWRLPSIKELATTVDDRLVAPAIDRSAFPGTAKSQWYWSSSPGLTDRHASDPSRPWGLNYDDGFTDFRRIDRGHVRCVH